MAVLILAHRGASGYAPENTLAAFDLAFAMGAGGIETDVRLTRDGVLDLVHDQRVDRTTNGTGNVAEISWAELQELDAGAWFGPQTAGQRVPQLDDVLDRYLGRGVLCLEVKALDAGEPLADLLRNRRLANRLDLQITSFSWAAACQAHDLLPQLSVGFLTPDFDTSTLDRLREVGLQQICPPAAALDAGTVQRAHAIGLTVRAWGVDSHDDLDRVYQSGADGTTLNWPDWAAQHLS